MSLARLLLERQRLAGVVGERERRMKAASNGGKELLKAEMAGLRERLGELGREIEAARRRGD